jgi:hypothetical protein
MYLHDDHVVLAVVGVLPPLYAGVRLGVLHDDALAQVVSGRSSQAALPPLQWPLIVVPRHPHKPAPANPCLVTIPGHLQTTREAYYPQARTCAGKTSFTSLLFELCAGTVSQS